MTVADARADCAEGSEEEIELKAIIDLIEAYDQRSAGPSVRRLAAKARLVLATFSGPGFGCKSATMADSHMPRIWA